MTGYVHDYGGGFAEGADRTPQEKKAMTPTKYLNFDLLIEREGDVYEANVISSPAGEASNKFEMPFSEEELKDFLERLGQPAERKSAEEFDEAAKDFGNRLFKSVFRDEVRDCLMRSRDRARDKECGLRIRLRFNDKEQGELKLTASQKEVQKLLALPWEYLYSPSLRFPSRVAETPVVRYMHLDEPVGELTVKGPLRILVMISSPDDYPLLDVDKEWKALNKAFADLRRNGVVDLKLLEDASETALQHELRTNPYHIFHFIGHGGYDAESGDGFLIMEHSEDEDEEKKRTVGRRLNGEGLADHLRSRRTLRLVVLNACDAGRVSLTDPFGGTAQSLVRAGIPAVIAMQFEITDNAAVDFAREFYKALADHCPVDAALADARLAMGDAEWGTPALYMRSEDGCLFSSESEPPDPPFPNNEMYYRMMVRDIRLGKLVPFLGARANLSGRKPGADWQQAPYPPSDSELAAYLSGVASDERELVQVSQYIALESAEFLSFSLHSALARDFETLPLHGFLATLPSYLRESCKPGESPHYQLIVTTNFDDALEQAFDAKHEPFDLVSYMAEGDYRGKFCHKSPDGETVIIERPEEYELEPDKHTVILKLCGAIDRADPEHDSYVITEDNYIDHLSPDFVRQIPLKLRERLLLSKRSSFAFLGYRLRDWNLRIIFRRIWGDLGPISTSWVIRPNPHTDNIQFWNKRNVKTLDASLDEFVEEMNKRLT